MTALHSAAVSTGPISPCWVTMCILSINEGTSFFSFIFNIIQTIYLLTRTKQIMKELSLTAVLALASEVRARINVVFKMTAVTTTSETNTVNI